MPANWQANLSLSCYILIRIICNSGVYFSGKICGDRIGKTNVLVNGKTTTHTGKTNYFKMALARL